MQNKIYVSSDGVNYDILDLFRTEKITLKQTAKDLTDITKVFLPFSLGFTVPASEKNLKILGFFGEVDHVKNFFEFKFYCKIVSGTADVFNGFLNVETGSYINKKAKHFNVKFETTTANLKDIIGDDTLQDLAVMPIDMGDRNIEMLLVGGDNQTINGINVSYCVPFVSNTRVWSYGLNSVLDDVKYNASYDANNLNLINAAELRPMIQLKSLVDLLIKKYNLNVIAPLFSTNEYNSIYVWCNEEAKPNELQNFNRVSVQNVFNEYLSDGSYSLTQLVTFNPLTSKFKAYRHINDPVSYTFILNFINVQIFNGFTESQFFLKITDANNGYSQTIDLLYQGGTSGSIGFIFYDLNNFQLTPENINGVDASFEFYLDFYCTAPISYDQFEIDFFVEYGFRGENNPIVDLRYKSVGNQDPTLIKTSYNNLFNLLPKTKILDFIKSLTTTFNLQIINNNPNSNELFWLRPSDINTVGLPYSKNTLDYTQFTDLQSVTKAVPTRFNKFNLKHATSKFFSNVNYKSQYGKEFGQVIYPDTNVVKPVEMKIETAFSIIPSVYVAGSNLITAYGFNNETPEKLPTGNVRYKPNYGELTLFHKLTSPMPVVELGIKSQNINRLFVNNKITNVNRVASFNSSNFSLAFSNIIFQNVEFSASLFEIYYKKALQRLLDPNVLLHNYKVKLPQGQMSINQYTTVDATNLTPTGFRIQNDIIIGEQLFTINDSTIDITTGDANVQFINY